MLADAQNNKQGHVSYKRRVFPFALVVILAPAILACVCLGLLDKVWLDNVNITRRLQDEIYFSIRASFGFQDAIECQALTAEFAHTGNPHAAQLAAQLKNSALDTARYLASFPTTSPLINEERASASQLIIESVKNAPLPSGLHPLKNTGVPDVLSHDNGGIGEYVHQAFVLPSKALQSLDKGTARINQLDQRELELQRLAKTIVLSGIAGSILFALVLVSVYARWINTRLAVLSDNARALSKGSKMQALAGSDEFAYLNAAVQQAAQRLADAASQKRSIMEMVAHDVRSPLAAANLALGLVEKQTVTDRARSIKSNVAIARINLRATVEFVDELLETERAMSTQSDTQQGGPNPEHHVRSSLSSLSRSGMFRFLLLLVLVPLMLQIGCFALLNNQVQTAASLANSQHRQRDVIRNSQIVMTREMRVLASMLLFNLTKDQRVKRLYHDDTLAAAQLQKLTIAQTPFPTDKDLQTRILNLIRNSVKLQEQLEVASVFDGDKALTGLTQEIRELAEIRAPLQMVQKIEVEFLALQAVETDRRMSTIQDYILLGLFANFLLVLLLVVAFSKDVNSRLIKLLSSVQTLDSTKSADPVGGNDEISLLDEALRQAKHDLQRAAEQSHFVVTRIADSIVTPLTVARSALDDVDEDLSEALPGDLKQKIAQSVQSIDRVRRLVDDLLITNKAGAQPMLLDRQPCELKQLIEESFNSVRSLAEQKGITLIDSSSAVSIKADKDRIIQVLANLLSNAIKFSPEDKPVEISTMASNDTITISVRDQGPGMDASAAQRVFDRYYQTDTGKQSLGFGLGLAIVKQIVDAHGGRIDVDTAAGIGSTFSLVMPRD